MLSALRNHKAQIIRFVPPILVTITIALSYSMYSGEPEKVHPKHWGDFSLEMVVDAIFERYEVRTDDFFLARNRATQLALKKTPGNLDLYDDMAVGYARLRQFKRALKTIEQKKSRIPHGNDYQWYRYFANRSSFLFNIGLHMVFKEGNPNGKSYLQKALQDIQKALKLVPSDHFYRDHFEQLTIEWFLKAIDKPQALNTENLLGLPAMNTARLETRGSPLECGKKYSRFLPKEVQERFSGNALAMRACPMLLRSLSADVMLGRVPDPYQFITIGDLLLEMGYPNYAWHAYARSVLLDHPSATTLKRFMKQLSYILAGPEDNPDTMYSTLWDQYHSRARDGADYSDAFRIHERGILKDGGLASSDHIVGSF